MSSDAQIEANRRNSQKSTGPTSSEGKAVCSQNALKSGIFAFYHVIRGEEPDEFDALQAAFLQQHHPADPTQLALVDTLIATEWTQRRLRRIEAELWAHQFESLDRNLTRAEFTNPNFHHHAPLGQCYLNALDPLNRLQRRIESTNRMFLRTLKALQDLQKATSPQETEPLTSPIGSVPRIATESAERPRVSPENHESSLAESLETDKCAFCLLTSLLKILATH
jgi:hypothetical protein